MDVKGGSSSGRPVDYADEDSGLHHTMIPEEYHRSRGPAASRAVQAAPGLAAEKLPSEEYPTQLFPPRGPPGSVRELALALGVALDAMLKDVHRADAAGQLNSLYPQSAWMPPRQPDASALSSIIDVHNTFGGDFVGLGVRAASYRRYLGLDPVQGRLTTTAEPDGSADAPDPTSATGLAAVPDVYVRNVDGYLRGEYKLRPRLVTQHGSLDEIKVESAAGSGGASTATAVAQQGQSLRVQPPETPADRKAAELAKKVAYLVQARTPERIAAESDVYLSGLHELARQIRGTCCEQGELLHTLAHRSATLVKAMYAATKLEAQRSWRSERQKLRMAVARLLRHHDKSLEVWLAQEKMTVDVQNKLKRKVLQAQARAQKLASADERIAAERNSGEELKRVLVELRAQKNALRRQVETQAAAITEFEEAQRGQAARLARERGITEEAEAALVREREAFRNSERNARDNQRTLQAEIVRLSEAVETAGVEVSRERELRAAAERRVSELLDEKASASGGPRDSKASVARRRRAAAGDPPGLNSEAREFYDRAKASGARVYSMLYDAAQYQVTLKPDEKIVATMGYKVALDRARKSAKRLQKQADAARKRALQSQAEALNLEVRPLRWVLNFVWRALRCKHRQDRVDRMAGCSRMSMPEFFLYMLLFSDTQGAQSPGKDDDHSDVGDDVQGDAAQDGGGDEKESGQGAGGRRTVDGRLDFSSGGENPVGRMRRFAWNLLHSLYVHAAEGSVLSALFLNFVEEWLSLDTLNFALDLMATTASCHVGVSYPESRRGPGDRNWVCYLRARWVASEVFAPFGPEVASSVGRKVLAASVPSGIEVQALRRAARSKRREDPLGKAFAGLDKIKNTNKTNNAHRKIKFEDFLNVCVGDYCAQMAARKAAALVVGNGEEGDGKPADTPAVDVAGEYLPFSRVASMVRERLPSCTNEPWLRRRYLDAVTGQRTLGIADTVVFCRGVDAQKGAPDAIDATSGHRALIPRARIAEPIAQGFVAAVRGSWQRIGPLVDDLAKALEARKVANAEAFASQDRVFAGMLSARRERLQGLLDAEEEQVSVQDIVRCYQQLLDEVTQYCRYRQHERCVRLGSHSMLRVTSSQEALETLKKELAFFTELARLKVKQTIGGARI